MARYLIDRGADLNAKNKVGQTPYDLAKASHRLGLIVTLNPTAVKVRAGVKKITGKIKQEFAH